ncbi:MAG: hypothetical protein ACLRTQ_10915 [Candidatus Borkfalkia sp.]
MISVRFFLKEGYPVSCELKDGENVFFGGVTAQGEFFCEKGVPYPEMMLRARQQMYGRAYSRALCQGRMGRRSCAVRL